MSVQKKQSFFQLTNLAATPSIYSSSCLRSQDRLHADSFELRKIFVPFYAWVYVPYICLQYVVIQWRTEQTRWRRQGTIMCTTIVVSTPDTIQMDPNTKGSLDNSFLLFRSLAYIILQPPGGKKTGRKGKFCHSIHLFFFPFLPLTHSRKVLFLSSSSILFFSHIVM